MDNITLQLFAQFSSHLRVPLRTGSRSRIASCRALLILILLIGHFHPVFCVLCCFLVFALYQQFILAGLL
jgi:hypothetical protein